MTPQEKQEFEEMKIFINSLKAASRIPFEVRQAILNGIVSPILQPNKKLSSTETTTVLIDIIGGTALVAKPMDGFIKIYVNGIPRLVPYYD